MRATLLLALLTLAACAEPGPGAGPPPAPLVAPEGRALVVVYRPVEFLGDGEVYGVRIGGVDVADLVMGRRQAVAVDPGPVSIEARTLPHIFNLGLKLALMARPRLDFTADQGVVHYIRVTSDRLVGGPELALAQPNIAMAEVAELKPAGAPGLGAAQPTLVVAVGALEGRTPDAPRAAQPRRLAAAAAIGGAVEARKIGARTAAFGVPMGAVYLDRDPAAFIAEVLLADLRAAGHEIVAPAAGPTLSVRLERFWVETDTTPLYWDVEGEIAVVLSLAGQAAAPRTARLTCAASERTYLWPGEEIFLGVIERCVTDLVRGLRASDLLAAEGA